MKLKLVGDIGGTKSQLAIYNHDNRIVWQEKFLNNKYETFISLLDQNLPDYDIDVITLAVAGPIKEGIVDMTNLEWTISSNELKNTYQVKVCLINDLQALGYFVVSNDLKDTTQIIQGSSTEFSRALLVSVGTGLGKSLVIKNDDNIAVIEGEGGHTGFSPHTSFDLDLIKYLLDQYDHVSYEMVCSKIGFQNLTSFILDEHPDQLSSDLKDAISSTNDVAKVIFEYAESSPNSGAREIIKRTSSYLASFLGDQALSSLPDIIFLAGGITSGIKNYLKLVNFKRDFMQKGKISTVLSNRGISIIEDDLAVVKGALSYTIHQID